MYDTAVARLSQKPSGRFLLRISPGLHAALRASAEESGASLNELCAGVLSRSVGGLGSDEGASLAVRRAADLFGSGLVAVAIFGSWARGDAGQGSDVDLLVVIESDVALERSLYRRWDEDQLVWEGRPVEPHFVHLPAPGVVAAGLWAEVAIDGIVLFERGFALSRRLIGVRRDIVAGRIVRRDSHGLPYWVEAA